MAAAVRAKHDRVPTRAPHESTAPSAWIVSPAFDLAFLVNVGWLLAWLPALFDVNLVEDVEFWRVYFLTTPHRWLTLLLVASDPDRRGGRDRTFLAIAIAAAVVVEGAWWSSGQFLCLVLVDYVWNSWHFAAQHAGVLRMYARKAGGGRPWLETWGIRTLVFYVSIRLAGWATGWLEWLPSAVPVVTVLDVGILILPATLIVLELNARPWARPGKVAYLLSVVGLYASLLLAVTQGWKTAVLSLTAAAAAFHAIEYLAIVTHYALRRQTQGSRCAFRTMAQHWSTLFAAYIVCFGAMAFVADRLDAEVWLGINLWAAAMHYALDGMIWKLRAPQTAQTLGVELRAPGPTGTAVRVSTELART